MNNFNDDQNLNQNQPNYQQPQNQPNYQQQQFQNQRPVPPKSWLLESILVTLFCCLPFGIAGIVYASKVENAFYMGNIQESERLSREAGKWTKVSFWVGLAAIIIYFMLIMFGAVSGFMSGMMNGGY